jgi:hypothetical protein
MKTLLFLCLLFLSRTYAQVQHDIVFKSRFDMESSQAFINQLRIFLAQNNFKDPYSREFEKPVVIDLAQVLTEVPEDTQEWIRELQSVLQLKPFESEYKVIVERFGYAISDFNTDLKPGFSSEQRVEYVTVNFVRGLHLTADKIVFEVALKQTRGEDPIKFKVELIRPEFIVHEDLVAELPMGWATSVVPSEVLLSLDVVNIEKLMQEIVKSPKLIDLRLKDLIIPDVSVRMGSKTVKFDPMKLRNFLNSREEDLKKGILDVLNVRMHERFSNILKDSPQKLFLPREYPFSSDISGEINVQSMDVNNTGIVQIDLDGFFCESADPTSSARCRETEIKIKPRREIPYSSYQRSMREINRSLIEKSTNVAVSVSEGYLNQLIEATVRSGLWEDQLKGKDFALGPEKSFVLADERGENFSIYLDIIYKLRGSQRILVGRSELRFPIKFMIGVNVEEIDGVPHFTIRVNKVVTDDQLLMNGAPDYGLPTTLKGVRFKNKVLKAIKDEIKTFEKTVLVDLEMQELKGTYLKQLKFFSDGHGRGSATIGFGKLLPNEKYNPKRIPR